MFTQVNENLVDFVVAGNVAAEHEFGTQFGGHFADALFQFVNNVGKRQIRALFAAGFGNAVSDGTLGNHAGDQDFFTLQKTHFLSFKVWYCGLMKLGIIANWGGFGIEKKR